MLWLIGLGIAPIYNPPGRPTENAKVERTNGTVNRWAEPERCADYAAWKQKLGWVARVQREEYPAVRGKSRLAAHPELTAPPRAYRREKEEEEWQLGRGTSYLGQGKWRRAGSQRGPSSLSRRAGGGG